MSFEEHINFAYYNTCSSLIGNMANKLFFAKSSRFSLLFGKFAVYVNPFGIFEQILRSLFWKFWKITKRKSEFCIYDVSLLFIYVDKSICVVKYRLIRLLWSILEPISDF